MIQSGELHALVALQCISHHSQSPESTELLNRVELRFQSCLLCHENCNKHRQDDATTKMCEKLTADITADIILVLIENLLVCLGLALRPQKSAHSGLHQPNSLKSVKCRYGPTAPSPPLIV